MHEQDKEVCYLFLMEIIEDVLRPISKN